MIWHLDFLWAIAVAVGGAWWVASNQERLGRGAILGLLPWSRGVLLGGLTFGMTIDSSFALMLAIGVAAGTGGGALDARGNLIGSKIPNELGRACLFLGEAASVIIGSLALAGLLLGSPVGGGSTAWLFERGSAGMLSIHFRDGAEPARVWQFVAAAWAVAIIYYSHALARQMKAKASPEEPPAEPPTP